MEKMFICIYLFQFCFFWMPDHIFVLCDQNSDSSLQPVVSWYFTWQLATKHTLSKSAQCSKKQVVSITLFLFHRTRPCGSLMRRRFGLQMHQWEDPILQCTNLLREQVANWQSRWHLWSHDRFCILFCVE